VPQRRAVAGQVVGRGADHRGAVGQAARDQARLQLVADADGQVHALFDQVHGARVHAEVNGCQRMALQKHRRRRRQHLLCERLRTGQAQKAAHRVGLAFVLGHAGQFARHLQQLAAVGQRLFSGVREAEAARGPVQQPRAGPLLHLREVARDHGARHVQRSGGRRHAAALGDLDEDFSGGQAVHDFIE